jgi:hypothetical protein
MATILLYSSLFFITNAIVAYYKKYYMYSFFFGMLTITSLLVHSQHYDPLFSNILDKIAIACVIACGFYIFLGKLSPENIVYSLLIVLFFFSTGFLYMYGFLVEDYCFHKDRRTANNYHCLMHFLSCAGHHVIIAL